MLAALLPRRPGPLCACRPRDRRRDPRRLGLSHEKIVRTLASRRGPVITPPQRSMFRQGGSSTFRQDDALKKGSGQRAGSSGSHTRPAGVQGDGAVQGAGVLGRSAHGKPSSRELSRRHQALRGHAGDARLHLLRRGHACDHGAAEPGGPHPADPGGDRRVPRRRHRPEAPHRLQPVPGAPARGARLGVQLRRPPRLAQPHDPVQGQGRQGPGERLRGPLRLSEPDGGRHPGLPRHPCAGGRGPEAAPGADPRHRPEVQQRLGRVDRGARLRRGLLPAHRAA